MHRFLFSYVLSFNLMSLCLFCFNLGIWGSAFSILLNQVIGGDTDEKKSEEGELVLGKDQNEFNLRSNNIMRSLFVIRVGKWLCLQFQLQWNPINTTAVEPKKCGCVNGVVVLTGVDQITVHIFF